MRVRPKTELVLSEAERDQLKALTLRRKIAWAKVLRARTVLGCASRMQNKTAASRRRVTPQGGSKWRALMLKGDVKYRFVIDCACLSV